MNNSNECVDTPLYSCKIAMIYSLFSPATYTHFSEFNFYEASYEHLESTLCNHLSSNKRIVILSGRGLLTTTTDLLEGKKLVAFESSNLIVLCRLRSCHRAMERAMGNIYRYLLFPSC